MQSPVWSSLAVKASALEDDTIEISSVNNISFFIFNKFINS